MDSLTKHVQLFSRCPLWAIMPESFMSLVLASPTFMLLRAQTIGKGDNKLAVIPIQGVLTRDDGWAGTTYQSIADATERAAADASVKRIVLAVDSPGGEIAGLPETAAVIAAAAKVKPVSAIVEGTSASAAYYLTSQATDITMAPSAEVGSVGVRTMHVDMSKMLEKAGYSVTELHAGMFKTEWSPFQPLTEAAKEDMQKRLDTAHADFLSAVSTGRGPRATEDIKAARFGEGRMFSAKDAMGHGMVDAVSSPREFYRSVTPPVEPTPEPHGLPRRERLELEKARY